MVDQLSTIPIDQPNVLYNNKWKHYTNDYYHNNENYLFYIIPLGHARRLSLLKKGITITIT